MSERELLEQIIQRKNFLEYYLSKLKKLNEKLKPEFLGKIRVQKHGNGFQYYLRDDHKDTSGRYLGVSQKNQVKEFLQKEYNLSIIKMMEEELKQISRYVEHTSPTKMMDQYSNLSEGRKRMVNPFILDDEEFILRWEAVKFEGKSFSEDAPMFYTHKGERVRSKSEVIIANLLYKYQIPYRYEFPVTIKDFGITYPDFITLNVRKRKEIYIEHFGLLDDATYRENALRKITKYEMAGISLGDNLLLSFETLKNPLNIQLVEKKIKEKLL